MKITVQDDLKIGVIGLGHVGLPTALGLSDLGWTVLGVDDDAAKAQLIAQGETSFYEQGLDELLRKHLHTSRFRVTDMASSVRESTVLLLCVDTPQREDGRADTSHIESAVEAIAGYTDGYKLIVEKSTAPVGTAAWIENYMQRYSEVAYFETRKLTPSCDVAVNPEFLRAGSAIHDFFNPDRIVIGVRTERAGWLLSQVFQPLFDRAGKVAQDAMLVTDINSAEIIKHASNAFLATKVSFVNMVADICEATGANIDDVSRGMGTDPRIAPHLLEPGIGFGGSCLPKDLRAFDGIASGAGVDSSILREVEKVNQRRIDRFMDKLRQAIGEIYGKSIAVWGLSFKPRTDDIREAPSLEIVDRLIKEGAMLRLHDPQAMEQFQAKFPPDPPMLTYVNSAESAGDGADAVLLLTEWQEYLNLDLIRVRDRMSTPLMVDGRNAMDPETVRALGFKYHSFGRPSVVSPTV